MLEIDGGEKSGSGTILRYAVSLASLLNEELHLINIRAKRKKPGLRPQHFKSLLACRAMTQGKLESAEVGSQEIFYRPKISPQGGRYEWDIGTAGSTTMLAMTVLPLAAFASSPGHFIIKGGLFQDFAPSAFHMQKVLFPLLARMGLEVSLKVIRPGYVPEGGGLIEIKVTPVKQSLFPLKLIEPGKINLVQGLALSSHLKEGKVSDRMAKSCQKILEKNEFSTQLEIQYEKTAPQKGATLAIWTQTSSGCLLGSDQAGKLGRTSESIGNFVAQNFLEDIKSGATVDRHLADQLIIYAALAQGISEYIIPQMTEHIETNLWLVEKILGVSTQVKGKHLIIQGRGFSI